MMNKFLLLPLFLLLTACASLNSEFDCPKSSGVRCESIDQINMRVDRGEIGNKSTKAKINNNFIDLFSKLTISPYNDIRGAETIQKIWIAPYEDEEGNYHKDTEIYVVAKKGFWKNTNIKLEKND